MQIRLKLTKGTGAVGKDNEPWTPGTMWTKLKDRLIPVSYSPERLAEALLDPAVSRVEIIDHHNSLYIVEVERTP